MILLDATVNGKPAVLLLDTGSNVSFVDMHLAGLIQFKADKVRRLGMSGCLVAHEQLFDSPDRRPCVADLSDISKSVKERIDGLLGQDILREFSAIRIDCRNSVVELQ